MNQDKTVVTERSVRRTAHSDEVIAAHARVLAGSGALSRYVNLSPGQRIHVIESGDGPSLVLLHGSGPTALQLLPLLNRLRSVHAIAVDRPGFGLSDPADQPPNRRDAAVASLTAILDSSACAQRPSWATPQAAPGRCGTRLPTPTACRGSCSSAPRRCWLEPACRPPCSQWPPRLPRRRRRRRCRLRPASPWSRA